MLRVYAQLEEITRELYNLADDAVDLGDFDDASLLQARATIIYDTDGKFRRGDFRIRRLT